MESDRDLNALIDAGPRDKAVIVVQHANNGILSYSWRFWNAKTYFYIKPRYTPVSSWKISLHGPRHPGDTYLWKADLEHPEALPRAQADGGVILGAARPFTSVPGKRIPHGIRHAVRIRHPWTAFNHGMPSGPDPGAVRAKELATPPVPDRLPSPPRRSESSPGPRRLTEELGTLPRPDGMLCLSGRFA